MVLTGIYNIILASALTERITHLSYGVFGRIVTAGVVASAVLVIAELVIYFIKSKGKDS